MAQQYVFGSGTLIGTSTASGTQTPLKFGAIQNVSVDYSFETKELYGSNQFPLSVARGKGKITGKASVAQVDALAYNSLFFGQTLNTGQTLMALNEIGTIPSTPFQVTVTNSASFVDDCGVIDVLTGIPMKRVASGPTTGQYSVASGVYTFASADTTLSKYITYTYTVTTGQTITIANQLMGSTPTFQIVFSEVYGGNTFTMKLNNCISSKLNFAFKNDDFNMSEFDFSAFADSAGNIGIVSVANQ